MGTVDVYRLPTTSMTPPLTNLVTRLEARGKSPRFAEMLRECVDAMAIDSARSVLDLGCGTGFAARAFARRVGICDRVTGIDRSPHLIGAAVRLAHEDGVDAKVDFRAGDSHSLKLREAEFECGRRPHPLQPTR